MQNNVLPLPLVKLIEQFERLPGIGKKSAQKLAFYVLSMSKDNKGLYRALFEKAGEEYLANPSAITSLDEYFACLKSLADINPIYTVLPLDEPVFSIDTNTRKITVPAEFSKNGVSVQGESSLTRTLVIFALAGIALCALIIYLKVSFDNTVKDKEFMETISGVSVIAYIEKQENHHARK